jgi:hypothetical protein
MATIFPKRNDFEAANSCQKCLKLRVGMYVSREGINTLSGKETVPLDPQHVSLFR